MGARQSQESHRISPSFVGVKNLMIFGFSAGAAEKSRVFSRAGAFAKTKTRSDSRAGSRRRRPDVQAFSSD